MNVESIVPKNKNTRYIDAKIGNRQTSKLYQCVPQLDIGLTLIIITRLWSI